MCQETGDKRRYFDAVYPRGFQRAIPDELISSTDQARYQSRQTGRNQVIVYKAVGK